MKKYKNKIWLANRLLDSLSELKKAKLRHIQNKFEEFNCKYTEAAKDSRIFHAAIDRGWFKSAEKIKTRLNRNLNDFSYRLQQFKILADSEEIKLPKTADIFADIVQIEQEFGHDPQKYLDHVYEAQKQHGDKLVRRRPKPLRKRRAM